MPTRARFLLFVAAAVLAGHAAPAMADGDLWIVDFEKAKAIAAKEGKDILMEFTGSDWCPPCKSLKKNVLDNEAFQKEAPKHFVLLKLDYPNDDSKQTKEEIAQNDRLKDDYKISGYPTIILVDAKGRPYAQMVGYSGAKAESYTENLVTKVEVRKERDKFFKEAEAAEGAKKAELLAKAISGIESELAINTYRDTVDQIIELDANNKSGLKKKYQDLLDTAEFKKKLDDIEASARGGDAEKALKAIADLIEKEKLTEGGSLQEALYLKAQVLFRSDKDACETALKQAVEAAPDTDRAKEIKSILKRLFSKDEKKSDPKK